MLAMQFSQDGVTLATGSEDHCARLWDLSDQKAPKEKARFQHKGQVWKLSFSPDGHHLGTGSFDCTARVWSITSGREVARMNHFGTVSGVAFSVDGRLLATASDRTLRFWLWQTATLLADVSSRVTRNLTLNEWRQYLPGEDYRPTFAGLAGPGTMVPQVNRDIVQPG